jgi:subtilase family serine protease
MHEHRYRLLSPFKSIPPHSILFLLAALLAMVPSMPCQAQSQSLPTRHVRESAVNGQAPLVGRLPATQVMHLVFALPLRHQAELGNLIAKLYDRSDPSYRHFLTVEEFTAQFGPSEEDCDAVSRFAEANGLTVTGRSRNRVNLEVSGRVADIEKALHVTMGVYKHPTKDRTFFAPDREPAPDLEVRLWHISGLDSYSVPHPALVRGTLAGTGNATIGSGPGASFLGSDMRAAYYGGPLTGSGQSLGLLEYYGTDLDDLNTYFANVGQTNIVPITVLSTDGTSTSCLASEGCDDTEQTIDMTQALGMAPGLSSLVMYVGSTDSAILNAMATANPLNAQLGSSWVWIPADPSTDDPYFEEFAAQGQTLFQAAGDSGEWTSASEIYPADDPYVISVGGTDLQTISGGGAWSSESAWADGGGGVSPDNFPIPSWQTSAADSCSSCSTTYRNGPDVSANADFTFYVCADQSDCSENVYGGTSFAAPMWAGYMALVNQQATSNGNPPVGFINPAVYAIGAGSNYDNDFHDITTGSNGGVATIGYDLATGWGSPNGSALLYALAGLPSSLGFILSASPASLRVLKGNSGTSIIGDTPTGGFDSAIVLSANAPNGVTVSFNPTSIAGSGTSTMTMTVGQSVPRGTYTITVTGTSGTTIETTTVFLTVSAVLTSIVVSPTSATITFPGTQQFTATGQYGDGSTQDLTTTATWASSNTSVATIASGLATAVAMGTTNITANFNGVTSNASVLSVLKQASTPGFSPMPSTYSTAQSVTLSDVSPGVNFYYTTDGSTPTAQSTPYTGPITVATTTTINAIAAGSGYAPSQVASGTYTMQAGTPGFSPMPSTYSTPQSVTLSDVSPGVIFYYTTDASTPTTQSTPYTGPITVSTSTTLSAVAAGNGFAASKVASGMYTMQAGTPGFSPMPSTYSTPQSVTLSDVSPGVTFYYTTDGSTPTTQSTPYAGPITVSSTTAINAIAAGNGFTPSHAASGTYTIQSGPPPPPPGNKQASAPGFSPMPSTYNRPVSVTLSDSSPGVTIYYTTDGSAPGTQSTPYSGPIAVSATTTINAVATGNGYGLSRAASGTYTLQAGTPGFSPMPSTYTRAQAVTLSDVSPGVSFYYTSDGSTPSIQSTLYTGPIAVSTTTTIKTLAAGNGFGPSQVATGTYTIQAATPSFSPMPSTYSRPQSVTLYDSTPAVVVYYTIDGSTPSSTNGTAYTGSLQITTTTTIKAIAIGTGYTPSAVATGTYTIGSQ